MCKRQTCLQERLIMQFPISKWLLLTHTAFEKSSENRFNQDRWFIEISLIGKIKSSSDLPILHKIEHYMLYRGHVILSILKCWLSKTYTSLAAQTVNNLLLCIMEPSKDTDCLRFQAASQCTIKSCLKI